MMASKRQAHHFFSVFIDFSSQRTEMQWLGYSERQAAWQFFRAIQTAERTPDACQVDLRRDGQPLACVNIKQAAIA